MTATPHIERIRVAVLQYFPDAIFGLFNCRHISSNPLRSWSQHAGSEPARGYRSNAADIVHADYGYSDSAIHQQWLREVYAFLRAYEAALEVDQLLGPGDKDHDNHVHVSPFPKMFALFAYRPPCKGGELIVVYADGSKGDTFGPMIPEEDNDMQIWLEALQRQTSAYYVALKEQTGHPGGRAGYWGESHDENGDRIATHPDDSEWDRAVVELATASLEAGVLSPGALPPLIPELPDFDELYAAKDHPHTVPGQTI